MTVKIYLKTAMQIYQKAYVHVRDLTVVHLCTAHIMHNLSTNLRQTTKHNKKQRKIVMTMMTCIVNSISLEAASDIFKDCCIILKSKEQTDEVKAALKRIRRKAIPYTDCEMDEEGKVSPSDNIPYEKDILDDEGTIMAASPFTAHFRNIEQNVEEDEGGHGLPNEFRSEQHLKLLLNKYLPIYPMLSGMLLGDLERYLPDSHTSEGQTNLPDSEEQTETRDTNAPVEAWFKMIKIDVLRRKRGLRLADFIRKLKKTIRGRLRERHYPSYSGNRGKNKTPSKKRKKMTSTLGDDSIGVDLSQDGWCRNKKRPKKSEASRSHQNAKMNKYPAVPPWGGQVRDANIKRNVCTLQDTCVIDNVMTILFLTYDSNAAFKKILDESARDNATVRCLLDVIEHMRGRRFAEAKVVWLKHTGVIQHCLPRLVSLYGGEWDRIGQPLNNLVHSSVDSMCNSIFCPAQRRQQELNGITLRYVLIYLVWQKPFWFMSHSF
jgi:hypothetical protein